MPFPLPLHVLGAAVALSTSVPLLWFAVSGARDSGVAGAGRFSRLWRRRDPGADAHQLALAASASDRVVRPAVTALRRQLRRLTPAGWVDGLERRVTLAGLSSRWPVERVLTAKVLLAAATLAAAIFGVGVATPNRLLVVGAATAFAYLFPDLVLRGKAAERQQLIEDELPDSLDQLTMSVDAGLGFEGALVRAARAGNGPLAQELTRTLQEMQLGVSRTDALRRLADRSTVRDLRSFVLAVIQSEQHGLPIAKILRVQAAELREKRRQRAEERALKVPVKIIFPLVFCIFPSLFIVVIGPGVIRVIRAIGGTGF